MNKAKIVGCIVFGSVILLAAQNSPTRSANSSRLVEVLSKAASVVRTKTTVPLRLPTHIAGLDDASKNELYAIESASETGYSIMLAAVPDCEGQHVCSYDTLSGGTGPLADNEDPDRPRSEVKLANGITAYFYDTVCGAYCDESWITWKEGQFHYTISLKAGRKADLVRAANSAIKAGTKTWQK